MTDDEWAELVTLRAERDDLRAEAANEAQWAEEYHREARQLRAERDRLAAALRDLIDTWNDPDGDVVEAFLRAREALGDPVHRPERDQGGEPT